MSFITVLLQQQKQTASKSTLEALLAAVVRRGESRVGDPYVWGGRSPGGFDCSGLVSWAYLGQLPAFTDAIYDHTVPVHSSLPGDIVLYEYDDPGQPGVRFPHVGLWIDENTTLDSRWPDGVNYHPHVVGATQYLRRAPGLTAMNLIESRFTPEVIAACLGSPIENVRSQWPLVLAALQEFGIADEPTQLAALATIGVEANAFLPVKEGYYLGDRAEAYRKTLWYYPYYGRGLAQLSLLENYGRAERELGITGLVNNPDRALEQQNSARILAWYFATHGGGPLIPQAARLGSWTRVRELVQGADAGLNDFLGYVRCLQSSVGGG